MNRRLRIKRRNKNFKNQLNSIEEENSYRSDSESFDNKSSL